MAGRRHGDNDANDANSDDEVQATRLAELVAELTGSPTGTALHAVRTEREARGTDDALEVVAGAMVSVDQPPPDGFRLAGFLRDDELAQDEPADDEP